MPVRYLYLRAKHQSVRNFLAGTGQCAQVQKDVLFTKLRRNAASAFGKDHGFSEIRSLEDFRRHVPITDHGYYVPYVERVRRGDLSAMFGPGTSVLMFASTSGTTSASKYFPVTNNFLREYRKSWNIWGVATYWDHLDLTRKKTLQFSSDWSKSRTDKGVPCGNISGLAAESRPFLARLVFAFPSSLNKIRNAADKQYAGLRLTLPSRHVGMIITANPLTLLNLARLADDEQERLVRDLYDGSLSDHVELTREVSAALRWRLRRRHRRRARELERIVARTGHLFPRDFWPRMSVLSVWTGSSMHGYLGKVRELYGDVVFRDHGLSATEGHMTTPFEDESAAGVLDYTSHYFEFIPEDEHEGENPSALEAHELEEGKNYFVLLTTSNGLYRYDIHDMVRCVGFEGACPLLEFIGKGARFSNMAGEKLSEYQAIAAVRDAFSELGISIEHFTLAPVAGDPPGYSLLIESGLDRAADERLARSVDACLCRVNCEYADRRESGRLAPVGVCRIPKGSWLALFRRSVSGEGGSAEQFKHPFLVNRQDFADQFSEAYTASGSGGEHFTN